VTKKFSNLGGVLCNPNEFLESCFTSKPVDGGATLSFKLLKNSEVEALQTATTYTLWSLWGDSDLATDAGALNTITFELPPVPEEEVPDEEVPEEKVDKPKWYERKTMQVTVGFALSFTSIALLLLLA
jgi:hypothetical protein